MRTIYKYELELTERTVHSMPDGAVMLTAAIQAGKICVWAEVDSELPKRDYAFIICGTGHHAPSALYIGTVQYGPYVWHIYYSYNP